MTAVEILRAAVKLLSEPSAWTQGAYARTKRDCLTHSVHPDAVRWCAVAAILKAGRKASPREVEGAMNAVLQADCVQRFSCIESWNDSPGCTHDEVLAAFREAIMALENKQ